MQLMSDPWKLWFVRFGGWPALLSAIAVTVVFMVAASVGLTKLGNLSVARSMLVAVVALIVLVVLGLGAMAWLSRV
jgi:hypothetical protein